MYFSDQLNNGRGFSLVELLIVIAILGVLASVVLATINSSREDAYLAKAQAEFRSFYTAIELYQLDNNTSDYPPDVNRGIPPGLEEYLTSDHWPDAPWPGGVYDWDNWSISGESERVVQLSIRFCEINQPSTCQFPTTEWADDFDVKSAVYFCIQGSCRSHEDEPEDHPGYCVNCSDEN